MKMEVLDFGKSNVKEKHEVKVLLSKLEETQKQLFDKCIEKEIVLVVTE